ncbi:hypothetical protein ACFFKC_03695 [Pseudoduganella danionis]|uniref:Uncharacterized protein n=1 Tax=Pseudoduganella danionis TaxID=1890295 RepID=A0ABW9SIL0_9BURK|nr:hypothetical protein [Pseudoduganella danionis]MTW31386.1 hypothetical protein [Pseudoduganella danionis]
MDQHKLRTLVFEKTGVKIDIDDPVFAVVALNEAVLEEAVQRHVALMDSTSRELVRHARAAGGLAAESPAARRQGTVLDATNEAPEAETAAHGAAAPTGQPASGSGAAGGTTSVTTEPASASLDGREKRLLMAATGLALLSAVLALAGQALFFKPAALPAPIVQQAKDLTPAQILALDRAEKLEKAILKLDPKTRAQLQAELPK